MVGSFWTKVCRKHKRRGVIEAKQKKNVNFIGYILIDPKETCDFPDCNEKAVYELFFSDKNYDKEARTFIFLK